MNHAIAIRCSTGDAARPDVRAALIAMITTLCISAAPVSAFAESPGVETGAPNASDDHPPAGSAPGVVIDVQEDGFVSVIGRSDSLVAVVRDLCARAQVDLEWVGPVDRKFVARYDHVSLEEAFERMLAGRSYMMGTRDAPDGSKRLWLRILDNGPAQTVRASFDAGPAGPIELVVGAVLLYQAFGDEGPTERREAAERIAENIRSDPDMFAAFLAADPQVMADTIRRHPGAADVLEQFAQTLPEPEARAKLDDVVMLLRAE